MSNQYQTLSAIQRAKETPISQKLVDDVNYTAPFLNELPSRVLQGTTYKHRRIKSYPKFGPKKVNSGVNSTISRYEIINAECFPYQGLIIMDEMVVDADGRGKGAAMAEEARNHMRGANVALEQAIIYGTKLGLENGTPGLIDGIGDYMTISADSAHNTEATKQKGGSSVWAINMRADQLNVIYGNNQGIRISPEKNQLVNVDGKDMPAVYRDIRAWVGLEVLTSFAVARLVNVTPSTPVTDDLLASMKSLFPANQGPTVFLMNSMALESLRKSRTAALDYVKGTSGSTTAAATPTESGGIRIIVTDSIIDDETDANIKALGKEVEVTLKQNTGVIKNLK